MFIPRHRAATGTARRITDLTEALARCSTDGPLVLDLEHPAVRAVLALYTSIKIADASGGLHSEDFVATVRGWFRAVGLDPRNTAEELKARIARTSGPHTRPPRTADDPHEDDDLNLDRVAEHVRAAGVACTISSPAPGVAILQAGPPEGHQVSTVPWRAVAGPGSYGSGDRPSTASTLTFTVGPDDLGETPGVNVRAVGAHTEFDIARLVVAQARREDPRQPLTAEEIAALGFDPRGLLSQ